MKGLGNLMASMKSLFEDFSADFDLPARLFFFIPSILWSEYPDLMLLDSFNVPYEGSCQVLHHCLQSHHNDIRTRLIKVR